MINRTRLGWMVAAGVAVIGIAWFLATRHSIVARPTGPVLQAAGPASDPIRSDEIQTILPQDAIPAIVNPRYISVSEASDIRPDEQVIGLVINGDARAFPTATLSAHEIVDDTIGGQPVAVTW